MARTRVLILGAAGRDFHNFNVYFRDNPAYEVVGFTATQIPDIAGRSYPARLAGALYPDGIPIYDEADMERLIRDLRVDQVVFAYSDVSHEYVMHRASAAMAAGADFRLMGPGTTMLRSARPVVAVCAVRTGAGKSQTTRAVVRALRAQGRRVVAIRHPMPYGDIASQAVQRFAAYEDLDRHRCTIEEREEYEPHIAMGAVIYSGVDYAEILRQAEAEADVIVWDGGNNDFPFIRPDVLITVADPLRAGHERTFHPGETNLRMADVVVINKIDSAAPESVEAVRQSVRELNPRAEVVDAASPITVSDPEQIRGRRVLVIEDGPTLTHGGMAYGAGYVAARRFGAAEIVDPRPHAVGSIAETFRRYPQTTDVLPAMGYGERQLRELEATIQATPCDVVVSGTPIDLGRVIRADKPIVRVTYELQEIGRPTLAEILARRLPAAGRDGAAPVPPAAAEKAGVRPGS
ncbi:cyclic 2,3-diphosphoglycerate synthase [Caldinitratiruptor microaerophilus]|uniref:GTPase n=1 Tax=Caldinitratiruptor microaerophilus TaxID=671077 RepID=A0AA35CPB0_9FIRM|nr:cyclic 2,3-diphosphoglycerate synthase [Caldinitratiruptor microaerophilus]BDG61196.1 GTPase [Caldinitratiruptor microaerophilus]